MKKFDTEYSSNKKADLTTIKKIIDELFSDDSEVWLSVYDTSKHNLNYIQIHCDIEDFEDDALNFIHKVLMIPLENFDDIQQIYLIEYRKYLDQNNFKHYRAFLVDANRVYHYFEKYMNDEDINIENWYDVTKEFKED